MNSFSGTGVAVVTPFQADLSVDAPALRRLIQHLIQGQVEYLVALGTTGESSTLSESEKTRVLDIFAEETAGKIPLVIGAGGNDTQKVAKTIQQWDQQYAPAGFLSVCPYYNKPTQAGLYEHFRLLAQQTDLPIILYNVPGRSACNMRAETSLRLARDCENIKAIKEASGNLEQMMEILANKPEGFEVLAGDDLIALPLIALGGKGVISVVANAFPLEFSTAVRASLAGDWELARKWQYRFLPLIQQLFQEGNPAGIKSLLYQLGLGEPVVRLPLVAASEELALQLAATAQQIS